MRKLLPTCAAAACVKTEQLGLVLLGAGIGLLVSFALCGWFLRVLVAIILIVLGLLLLK